MKTLFLALALLFPLIANGQVSTRATNGVVKGLTTLGTTTNLAVGVNKIVGTGPQGQEKGALLSGLTWDGTTLALYSAPVISSFVNNLTSVEFGTVVPSTVLTWTLSGAAITAQYLNQGIGSRPIGDRDYTDPTDYSTARTYTLTVTDGTTSNSANSTVTFYQKAYWGATNLTSLNDAEILTLSSEPATSRVRTKSINAENAYIYIAYPSSFGEATFVVDNFPDEGWTLVTRDFVNAAGGSSEYHIYRHTLIFTTGTYVVKVE